MLEVTKSRGRALSMMRAKERIHRSCETTLERNGNFYVLHQARTDKAYYYQPMQEHKLLDYQWNGLFRNILITFIITCIVISTLRLSI